MALEDDNSSDLRRKAMRNGEEDPFTVAQRYLNIYRQIHIFSPERKASFDKMILELSPEIRNIFSRLPGGAMLQDYVDDLAEKNGLSVSRTPNLSYEEYTPATEIPVQAAPVNPTPVQAAPIQATPVQAAPVVQTIIPQMGPAKISFDKDFANEFARIIGDVMQKQSVIQKNNLETLVQNLSKTQMFIAKNIKEKIEAKEMVYDTDLKDFRECTYKDFAILVADSVLFNSINRLNKLLIPFVIDKFYVVH